MYIRPVHAELDLPVLQQFVKDNPLGLFTTAIKHDKHATIQTTHIPWIIDVPDDGSPGVIRAHMARANPQAKVLIDAATAAGGANGSVELPDEVLVLFNAPAHSYVTPKFYTTTKPDTGKVVPTWNYAAVQAYGPLRVYASGDETKAFLDKQVAELTLQQEVAAGYAAKPWTVDEAPVKYSDLLKKAIIGLEIKVERLEGRFKLSQESGEGDWNGVVDGFKGLGTANGDAMAKMVQDRCPHAKA